MIPYLPPYLPYVILAGLIWAYAVFLAAVLRKAYHRHGRALPRPRPHRLLMAGRHCELGARRAARRKARRNAREQRRLARARRAAYIAQHA